MIRWIFLFFFALFLAFGGVAHAAQIGAVLHFTVDPTFDLSGRTELDASLVLETQKLYFYVDKIWWNSLDFTRQSQILLQFSTLDQEFENRIYPILTSTYGSEWNPGIDGDPKLTLLIQQMKEGSAGYFREADEHLKLQVPDSNEREMLYLATGFIDSPLLKSFVAHEFTHLITYNQKDRLRHVSEDTWLNEARAEYAPTLLGYNSVLQGSELEMRTNAFLENPTSSLVEWKERPQDYGVVSLFTHYLVDHYGVGILLDSLQSDKVGIASINEALQKSGFTVNFSKIFTDWTIAMFLNDCSYGKNYCYLNQNLANIKLTANTNFLPLIGKSTLSVEHTTKNWNGNWFRFVGGQGALEFTFQGLKGLNYRVPYLVQDVKGNYTLAFLSLNDMEIGTFYISHFGIDNKALIVIPSLQSKVTGFEDGEPTYPLSFTVSVVDRTLQEEQALIAQLLTQIDSLQKQIAQVQSQIQAVENFHLSPLSCGPFTADFGFGSKDHEAVYCLQKALAAQGDSIYPEGFLTGNFGALTLQAVMRFQEKYASDILQPVGLQKGTGFVGAKTRAKLNSFL